MYLLLHLLRASPDALLCPCLVDLCSWIKVNIDGLGQTICRAYMAILLQTISLYNQGLMTEMPEKPVLGQRLNKQCVLAQEHLCIAVVKNITKCIQLSGVYPLRCESSRIA